MSDAPAAPTRSTSAVRRWWSLVCNPETGDAASRAKLRRARSGSEAMLVPAAIRLASMTMSDTDQSYLDNRFNTAMDLARVLAHVREDTSEHPMRVVGWDRVPREGAAESDTPPKLAETRFRRLIQVREGEERVTAFVRLIALLDGKANVAEIGRAFRGWEFEDARIKQEWAFQYYNAALAAPSRVQSSTSTNTNEDSYE